ncbi:hypothetical protein NQ016_01320 [Staphylococcus hyicus]|uniref:hypothetical protein n=1 Tax=Staphylococcus hyicus TaxID=1284 RepID=UPI000580248F|nr:hypothetical protein [Staphylococcus hyicus]AJC96697.1 hypothetical protein SHYC_09835 [Staphylococcus hyicus]MCQ9290158.1 hypothetical protein [Staphylococcus hyicus]MCQ9305399.1 hypothetical protein [Staphylococcus hyicus]MCQ9307811.1 hypothetical protein [Staphylococcus hyicus]MCQ9310234.1 hypothetical protein [Staphylococcus hyicus]
MRYSNDKPEVIDPDDPRYRRPDDFNQHNGRHNDQDFYNGRYQDYNNNERHIYYRSYGCTPGCFPGCLFSIILSIILTLLLNMFLS